MSTFSLIQRGHSAKVTGNVTVKSISFSKPFQLFVFELLLYLKIRVINQMIFCFIFSIPYSTKIFNRLAGKVTVQGFSESFFEINRQKQHDGVYVE